MVDTHHSITNDGYWTRDGGNIVSSYAVPIGQIIDFHFTPGFVVLSYAVSFIGAITTLEILSKRTSGRGLYNWGLIVAASNSMGAVTIWCMHYIAIRATVMGDGSHYLQLDFDAGVMALSFMVAVLALLAAFLAIPASENASKQHVVIRLAVGGLLSGAAICGMHYIGMTSISNYTCIYNAGNVVGSAILAVAAVTTALTIFFVLRAAWIDSWWKRALCAVVLAGAVSGMHWVSVVGMQFRFKSNGQHSRISRNRIVVIVLVLSVGSCAILLLLTLLAQKRRRKLSERVHQLVLASATFDDDGRIMVTPEGLFPIRKITDYYFETSFDDVFDISHPAFLWIFRASHNWRAINDVIPSMREHVFRIASFNTRQRTFLSSLLAPRQHTLGSEERPKDYSTIFCQRFCVAASELARTLNVSLENVGSLFDEIMSTGTKTAQLRDRLRWLNLERGTTNPFLNGRGQVLFLVRRVNKTQSTRLQSSGYRFALAQNIADIIAQSFEVPTEDVSLHIESMRKYSNCKNFIEAGVHLTCFAIRPSLARGFEILVSKEARNRLPAVHLPFKLTEQWQRDFLSQFDNRSVTDCLQSLKSIPPFYSQQERKFALQFHTGVKALSDEIGHSGFSDAVFVSRAFNVPQDSAEGSSGNDKVIILAFRQIFNVHARFISSHLEFGSLSLFKCRQQMGRGELETFAHQVRREFAHDTENRPALVNDIHAQRPLLKPDRRSRFMPSQVESVWKPHQSSTPSQSRTSDVSSNNTLVESQQAQLFGGILVGSGFTTDVHHIVPESNNNNIEMNELARTNQECSKSGEEVTFADELFDLCMSQR